MRRIRRRRTLRRRAATSSRIGTSPTQAIFPTLPTDAMLPIDPMLRMLPRLPALARLPTLPALANDAMLPAEAKLAIDPALANDAMLPAEYSDASEPSSQVDSSGSGEAGSVTGPASRRPDRADNRRVAATNGRVWCIRIRRLGYSGELGVRPTSTAPQNPPVTTKPAGTRSWTTLWYYPVVVVSLGLLTAIPFAHAAMRLRGTATGRWCLVAGVLYTAAIAANALLTSGVQPDRQYLNGLLSFAVIVGACMHLMFVRRAISDVRPADPAVVAVLDARRRRDDARRIVARDPRMARELRIGRPDLTRTFDDGGLVDLNSAPASVIADACGIDPAVAGRLVDARVAAGTPFVRVDDAFTYSDVPIELWDRIREHAVVVP